MSQAPGRLADSIRRVELCDGVGALFTSRHGGQSADPYGELNLSLLVGEDTEVVRANRAQVLEAACAIAPGPADLAAMRQVHGAEVAYAGGRSGGAEPEADAIFTDSPDVALSGTGGRLRAGPARRSGGPPDRSGARRPGRVWPPGWCPRS